MSHRRRTNLSPRTAPRLSVPGPGPKIYPYRLGRLKIDRPDHVWASDIAYIRLRQGIVYLVAIMDWFSRYVLAWEASISLESAFCLAALDWAIDDGATRDLQYRPRDYGGR